MAHKITLPLPKGWEVEQELILEEGEEVLWADPDDSARDLNVTWKVRDLISSELVSIITSNEKDGFNIVKVKPSELVKKSSIIHVEYDAGCGSMG